jgi:uncharacterized protein (TIGR02118 family)
MTHQFKKIAFLTPRDGMSHDAFTRYWREIHGPLVAASPGYGAYRQKYVQNHFIGPSFGAPFEYSGMAEFWLPGDNEDVFASTDIYLQRIRIDEMKFIDMDRTVSMTATEEIVRPGTGSIKLVVVHRHLSKISSYARLDGLRGQTNNLILKDSFRLPGARPVSGEIERLDEYWFDSGAEADRHLETLAGEEGWSAFQAKEYVFFDRVPQAPLK